LPLVNRMKRAMLGARMPLCGVFVGGVAHGRGGRSFWGLRWVLEES